MPFPASPTRSVRDAVRGVWREAAKFGAIGALAFVVDNGGYNLLVFGLPGESGDGVMRAAPVQASVLATAAAALFGWVGNRYWTYRRQHRADMARELALFLVANGVGLVITAGTVFASRQLLGLDSALSDNTARIVGWVLATLFRFHTYRRYVFAAAPAGARRTASIRHMGRTVWMWRREQRWLWVLAAVAAFCCLGTVLVFSPGFLSPDSLDQLRQAQGKAPLTDWHPPVLSLVWRALIAVTGSVGSLLVVQSLVLWGALWVLAWCVWEPTGRRGGSLAVLGVGLAPFVLTFAGVVWKDVHAAFALLAACAVALTGLRLRDRAVRPAVRWALLGLGVLFLAYAMLVRKNAFIAAIPVFVLLVLALRPGPGRRTWAVCTAVLVAGLVVPAAAVSRFAEPLQTRQGAQILLDDLVHVLSVEELRTADVRPGLRDRLVASARECARIGALSDAYWACYERPADGLRGDAGALTSLWLREMSGHVPGYLQYRLRLFGTLLFETDYTYKAGITRNDLGVEVAHPRLEDMLGTYVNSMATDLRWLFRGWFWLAVALVLAIRPGGGAFALPVRALGVSSAAYIIGYLPIMPATDFRYVYWPALACALGLVLLWAGRGVPPPPPERPGAAAERALTAHQPADAGGR
ncbi:GtrA family protein [Streptomyces sp. NPDC058766]|uniref:GtrA family protein n=1 Tax=Streptomyces sp. NPDC058766 TaxID=3346630 RepID=UPI0036BAD5F8